MLHLAQVKNNESVGGVKLQLLARQHSENFWEVINPEKHVPLANTDSLKTGFLVLVELSDNHEVLSIQHAKDWMLNFVQQYLTIGVTPAFLQEEVERTQRWRQDLTLQSQDLTRRHLEVEARLEQIQALEADSARKSQQVEATAMQLKAREEQLKAREEHLNTREEHLSTREEQLRAREEHLNTREQELEQTKQ
jgi:hypothetical protein